MFFFYFNTIAIETSLSLKVRFNLQRKYQSYIITQNKTLNLKSSAAFSINSIILVSETIQKVLFLSIECNVVIVYREKESREVRRQKFEICLEFLQSLFSQYQLHTNNLISHATQKDTPKSIIFVVNQFFKIAHFKKQHLYKQR